MKAASAAPSNQKIRQETQSKPFISLPVMARNIVCLYIYIYYIYTEDSRHNRKGVYSTM